MCNLDIIVGPSPGDRPLEQDWAWINWFFTSLEEADFVVMLFIFGTVYLMMLCIITTFVFACLKNRNISLIKPAADADGSIHFVSLLLSMFGTFMVIGGIAYIIYVLLVVHPYFYRHQPYALTVPYTLLTVSMHILALRLSPKASRIYKTWNVACLVPCGLILAISLFFYLFYWFTNII